MRVHSLSAPTLTHFERRHRDAVRDLLFRGYRTHTHLDWQETDQWLDDGERCPARLAWQNGRLQGILATSEALNQTCWLRVAAVSDRADAQSILTLLWDDLLPELRANGIKTVSLLVIRSWITSYVTRLGFQQAEEIITLRRAQKELAKSEPPDGMTIRLAETEDLPRILKIDNSAFAAPWQMSSDELRQALRIAASCTLAEMNGDIVGYQLSTLYFDGAHLARLAVAPQAQGIGVARTLLTDVLQRFARRNVHSMTVNTQLSNVRSQHLYANFGFERTGYDLPVWMVRLGNSSS
ncbi:MAG: GNAT family N-acetyltransferase [Anaerolineae bacterium]|nr:GNAT family N-acetyltransferase [Anaerolineae bacterium]